jgi:hypothetical protein
MKICNEPLEVTAEDGLVKVTGGCGVDVTMTPPAALGTSDDLFEGAAAAIGQTKMPGYRPPD